MVKGRGERRKRVGRGRGEGGREKERRKGRAGRREERRMVECWLKQTLLQFSEAFFISCTGVVLQESVQSQGSMASNEMSEVCDNDV